MTLWTWWAGGLVLAGVSLLFWRLTGRLLSGSGMLTPLVELQQERALAETQRAVEENPEAFLAAMQAATVQEFGPGVAAATATSQATVITAATNTRPLPWTAHLGFLLALPLGGFLARLGEGWRPSLSLGMTFDRLWGGGALGLGALVAGGLFVGFGTRMAGGCTVGHGLSGCSRLQPGSLIATATFMGAAVAASMALARVLS